MWAILLAILLFAPSQGPAATYRTTASVATPSEPLCQSNLQLPTPICHVFVIFLENQEVSKVLNSSFEGRYLAPHYAFAAQYYSVMHFSFPNYLAATAGFATNYQHTLHRASVVNLIQNHTPALTWDAFMQSMPQLCDQNFSNNYRAAHNPFVYYADIFANKSYCDAHDTTFVPWEKDVTKGKVPNYAFFAPNVTNDCWKFGLALCDKFLHNFLTPLINDSAVFSHSVFFVTYDEGAPTDLQSANGTANGGGHVYTVAVSPYACLGFASQVHYDHYNLLTTTEWLLGLGRIGSQDNWTANPPMKDLFCFPNGTVVGSPASFDRDSAIGVTAGSPPAAIERRTALDRLS